MIEINHKYAVKIPIAMYIYKIKMFVGMSVQKG